MRVGGKFPPHLPPFLESRKGRIERVVLLGFVPSVLATGMLKIADTRRVPARKYRTKIGILSEKMGLPISLLSYVGFPKQQAPFCSVMQAVELG